MDISGFYLCCFQEDLLTYLLELCPMLHVGATNNCKSHFFGSRAPGGPTGENIVTCHDKQTIYMDAGGV